MESEQKTLGRSTVAGGRRIHTGEGEEFTKNIRGQTDGNTTESTNIDSTQDIIPRILLLEKIKRLHVSHLCLSGAGIADVTGENSFHVVKNRRIDSSSRLCDSVLIYAVFTLTY